MTTEPLITNMDHFFAEAYQEQADGIARDCPEPRAPQMQAQYENAVQQATYFRERILAEAGR